MWDDQIVRLTIFDLTTSISNIKLKKLGPTLTSMDL